MLTFRDAPALLDFHCLFRQLSLVLQVNESQCIRGMYQINMYKSSRDGFEHWAKQHMVQVRNAGKPALLHKLGQILFRLP